MEKTGMLQKNKKILFFEKKRHNNKNEKSE